jgi:hypothetical protein
MTIVKLGFYEPGKLKRGVRLMQTKQSQDSTKESVSILRI